MSETVSQSVLTWATNAIGADTMDVEVMSLHGGSSPWLLRVKHGGRTRKMVLRTTSWRISRGQLATGAAALRVAAEHGLATPRLIASDLEGRATGTAATLETSVPGSSSMPTKVSAERLREAGAAIARVHKIPLEPQPDLPLRIHSLQAPNQTYQHAMKRRWATLYRASPDTEKPAVLDAFCELTGWPIDHAHRVMMGTRSTPILHLADDLVRNVGRPRGTTVLVHADIWAGNMMWDGDTCAALIDWKDAGVGDPGVDLGQLRMTMAVQYGVDAPAHVLEGWQCESGRQATNVPYWDAVAALNTSATLDDWEPCFDDEGNQVSSAAKTARRDAFLRSALDQLNCA